MRIELSIVLLGFYVVSYCSYQLPLHKGAHVVLIRSVGVGHSTHQPAYKRRFNSTERIIYWQSALTIPFATILGVQCVVGRTQTRATTSAGAISPESSIEFMLGRRSSINLPAPQKTSRAKYLQLDMQSRPRNECCKWASRTVQLNEF